ncbi:hypothetical protein, conserved [Trypanosoma cruzi]|uniref:Translin-associated factor X-interacting protein 1 N-terminal domain-containing protein n=1 Tax=Trypanosoma cruzi (strain CL Brener) TaxID=353153 RepID=Q4E4L4_TRYCC|nr:hypothetical protein, conserved [Trypanosoma cruzi]EAN99731.1 hypothetical protein, conserved [Trypanosoma cruzi]|eukprot:XP_821582.1 hypothetical protein [Trypanosoma cruzi strain CL Brener]
MGSNRRTCGKPKGGGDAEDDGDCDGGESGGATRGSKSLPLSVIPKSSSSKAVQPRKLPPLAMGPPCQLLAWPAKQKRIAGVSRAPLALQLEAFIRREHQLYLHEHRQCTHADTLHIVREAFSVLTEHFMEYRGVLSFIREEYEATVDEATNELRRLRTLNLEAESDRSFYVMELMRQREGFTTVISNQQAQLQANQGLILSLRDQVATLEKSNSELVTELRVKGKELEEMTTTSKLLANSMIEEAARNSQILQVHRSDERELGRLNAQVNLLKEKLDESDKRFNALLRQVMFENPVLTRRDESNGENFNEAQLPLNSEAKKDTKETDQSVVALQRRIDDLLLAYEQLKQQTTGSKVSSTTEYGEVLRSGESSCPPQDSGVIVMDHVNSSSKLIRSWLREENLTEREVDAMDYLLPPGKCEEDPLSFLKICHPVRNLRMKKRIVISMLREFWSSRQTNLHFSLKSYFMEWLRKKVGPGKVAEEVGLNIFSVCQRNFDDPECRAALLTFRSFLPEDVVLTWQKDIKGLENACRASPRVVNDTIQTALVENAIRVIMPEKSYVHMLELRLYLWRVSKGLEKVPVDMLFNESSHFTYILRKQFLYEVEEFTLQVVEAIRSLSEDSTTVSLQDITGAISNLDRGIPRGTLHRLVAEATQLTAMDVATADANFRVRLQTVLHRFRSSVLLRRATPPLGDDPTFGRRKSNGDDDGMRFIPPRADSVN